MNFFNAFGAFFLCSGAVGVFGSLLGVAIFAYIAKRARSRMTAISAAEQVAVRDLEPGYFKTAGRAVALGKPVVSPLARRSCLYFRFDVYQLQTQTVPNRSHGVGGINRGGRPQSDWRLVFSDQNATRFGVADKTGTAEVEAMDAETVLSEDARARSGLFSDCPPDLRRELERRYGFSTKGLLFNKELKYTEAVIEDGDRLFVIGDVEVSKRGGPVFVKGSSPFLVSDRDEAGVASHYRWQVVIGVVGAVVFGLVGLSCGGISVGVAIKSWLQAAAPAAPPPVVPADEIEAKEGPPSSFILWQVRPDPAAEAMSGPENPRGEIQYRGKTVVFPTGPSPYVILSPVKTRSGGAPANGALMRYDLSTMRPAGPDFQAPVDLGERHVLSADGAWLAARSIENPDAVRLWAPATGAPAGELPAQEFPGGFTRPVDFAGPGRLLTVSHADRFASGTEESAYQVWDIARRRPVVSFRAALAANWKRGVVTPGGRYYFMESTVGTNYRVSAWDLTTGELAGVVLFQRPPGAGGQAAGLAVSPNGRELAMVWRGGPGEFATVYVWDLGTAEQKAEFRIEPGLPNPDALWGEPGPACLQWVPDGSKWLVVGYLLVDRATGKVVGRVGKEPRTQHDVPPRRFLGPDFVTTRVRSGPGDALTFEPVRANP